MHNISKDDILKAFSKNNKKRSYLLFEYYYDLYFSKNYTADYIAEKITQDLGITITRGMIYKINERIINKQTNLPAPLPSAATSNLNPVTSSQVTESKENETEDSVESREERLKKKYNWTNKDDEPKKDEMYEAFKNRGLIK